MPARTSRCRHGRCSSACRNCWSKAATSREACRDADQRCAEGTAGALHSPRRSVELLVRARAQFIDALLRALWQQLLRTGARRPALALLAVGGYGRGELHPYSDVDILVLDARRRAADRAASARSWNGFITFLWDIGLEVGNSVRTARECAEESAADVGVMTTLLEARLLAGSTALVARDARRARALKGLAIAPVLRGQAAGAARAPPEGQRHGLQPRAERQERPRRTARPADHRLGGQAALRRAEPR